MNNTILQNMQKNINVLKWSCLGIAAIFVATMLASTPAAAFGGSPSTSSKSCKSGHRWCVKKNKCVNSRCRRGRVWSSRSCACVRRSSDLLNDDDLYFEAVKLVKADQYKDALDYLNRIKNRDQAPVLNYIGYSTRKLGRIDEGIVYYEKALAINPDYILTREYLGEALLLKGDLAGAKRQLAEIAKRCDAATCHEYQDLSEDIAKYISRQN